MDAGTTQTDKPIWRAVVDGVEHLVVKTGSTTRRFMTVQEEETFYNIFKGELQYRKPDVVFLWGGLLLERAIMRDSRDAGIPVAFYLVNGGYRDKTVFKDVSVVITDTQATADLYKERHDLDCKVVGKFIEPGGVKPLVPRRPDAITFINPSFEKGVSVFMPLVRLAAQELPEAKFLVVQSRGRWEHALEELKFRPEDFPNVKVISHQHDMRRVYASTRVLLLPSLWHESGARVIAEAQLNGIPVIASDTGGSAELIGKGGVVLPLPQEVRENRTKVVVTEEDLRPWLAELTRVIRDQQYYDDLCHITEIEGRKHDIEISTDRFINALAQAALSVAGKGSAPLARLAEVEH